MPTDNPLFRGGWSVRKFNAMVINDIWPEVLLFSLIATMVTLVSELTTHKLAINNGLLTVLGTVLGLVISFRTSSAYERYQEGRKMWTSIQIASRNLAQLIWIHVPNERLDKDKNKKQSTVHSVIEKKSMINLTQAFSVAVKHFLRGEVGVYYQDLYPLISFLPRYVNPAAEKVSSSDLTPLWQASEDGEYAYEHGITSRPATRTGSYANDTLVGNALVGGKEQAKGSWFSSFGSNKRPKSVYDPEKALPFVHVHRPLKPARNPPETTVYDYVPFLIIFKPIFSLFKKKTPKPTDRTHLGRKKKPELGDSNVPLEISLYLNNYIGFIIRSGLVQPAIASALVTNISTLQDVLSNLERIGSTPLPFAYQAHLRMSLWLYLALLPFQIWQNFHYLTIPGTAFASFLLLGFLEIGQEIENPFNYDLNDLDLDAFCVQIQRELHEVTAHTSPDPSEFLFGSWNQPFAPVDRRGADEIISAGENYTLSNTHHVEPGVASLRMAMLKNWMDVDEITKHAHHARF